MASLEGGIGSVATASGMSANLPLRRAHQGDNLVTSSACGGTHTLFDVTLGRFGINRIVDGAIGLHQSYRREHKGFYAESSGIPQVPFQISQRSLI